MPLPLRNLDTRRWADLVEEARALIPGHAPTWSDHNIHDPGITIVELLAWLVEQDIYRVNRIPERHRRKFLALIGFAPEPPRAAQTIVTFTLKDNASTQTLPKGIAVMARSSTHSYPFCTTRDLTILPVQIAAIQVYDGENFYNRTPAWKNGQDFPLLGNTPCVLENGDAEACPAFYLGLDDDPNGETACLWFWFQGERTGSEERDRIEAARPEEECDSNAEMRQSTIFHPFLHHTVRTVWEYYDEGAWRRLDPTAEEIKDNTRGLSLDGAVQIRLPKKMARKTLGVISEEYFYLRCRLEAGTPDMAPRLHNLAINAVPAIQAIPIHSEFKIKEGVKLTGPKPVPGSQHRLYLAFDSEGVITAMSTDLVGEGPEVMVLEYKPASDRDSGSLKATIAFIGRGSGLPGLKLSFPEAPVCCERAAVWISAIGGLEKWQQRPELDASKRGDHHFCLDPTTGEIRFGDGERGYPPDADATILVTGDITSGAGGNLPAHLSWKIVDEPLNRALIGKTNGETLKDLITAVDIITNPEAASGGADQEDIGQAARRAAEALWAHERLVDLCTARGCSSLDQLSRDRIINYAEPKRAVTLVDFERIALTIPGTQIQRVRAWAGIDANYPYLKAPGTVTVLAIPGLPEKSPQPTPGLLQAVRAYLDQRRVIGTRLVVVGPQYLQVRVKARVRAREGAARSKLRADIQAALDQFLDPLTGGPQHLGWPFGRDVYRSEILQVIDNDERVDHVLSLELIPGEGEARCGNLCVAPTWLVTPGKHIIEVE